MTNVSIQISEEGNNLGMSFIDEKDNPIDWNELDIEERSHILSLIASTYKFLNDHLNDKAPYLRESRSNRR